MGLFGKNKSEDSVEFLTLKIQRNITIFTFLVFLIIMAVYFYSIIKLDTPKIELSLRALNIFLPIITSWIGAIIAFYFSKEFSDALIKKINRHKKKDETVSKEINTMETFYKKDRDNLTKEYERVVFDLLSKINKQKKL